MENLVGFILPPVIAFINQKITNDTVRFIVSILVSMVVAVAIKYQELQFLTPEQFMSSVALIFSESQIAYRTYWHENSPVRKTFGV